MLDGTKFSTMISGRCACVRQISVMFGARTCRKSLFRILSPRLPKLERRLNINNTTAAKNVSNVQCSANILVSESLVKR